MIRQRLTVHQCLLLLMAGLALISWPARAETSAADLPQVQVELNGDNFHIEVEVTVAVDILTAWQVLTDYNHIAEFVPGMRSSHIISGVGAPLRVEQKGETGWLFFARDFKVVLDIEESPPADLKFRAVGGNMKRMDGEWRILEAGPDSVSLQYSADIIPDFWVPPLIGKGLMRGDIRKDIEGVMAEMLKRHSAKNPGGKAATERLNHVPLDMPQK